MPYKLRNKGICQCSECHETVTQNAQGCPYCGQFTASSTSSEQPGQVMPDWERKMLAKDIAEAQSEEKAKGCGCLLKTVLIIVAAFFGLIFLLILLSGQC